MKVLFDSQAFDMQRYGGVSRYFAALFESFNSSNQIEYVLPLGQSDNEYLSNLPPFAGKDISRKGFLAGKQFKGQKTLVKLFDKFDSNSSYNKTIKALKAGDFDLFHPTYYSPYFLKHIGKKPFVITVYDMIHEIYPELFKMDQFAAYKKQVIPKADIIIAISEHTKRDLINIYGLPEDKIKVIHLANSLEPVTGKPAGMRDLPAKYILYVGSRARYKNFGVFINAVTPLLKEDPDLHVVAAGGYSANNNFSEQELATFREAGIDKQMIQLSINDPKLAYLYQNALCFVFPSLYEGFGIPALESFACSCPTLLSNASSLPEVGGEAALYFDPANEEMMRDQIKKVITDKELRTSMISKGLERLSLFSWEKTAAETIEVYKNVL